MFHPDGKLHNLMGTLTGPEEISDFFSDLYTPPNPRIIGMSGPTFVFDENNAATVSNIVSMCTYMCMYVYTHTHVYVTGGLIRFDVIANVQVVYTPTEDGEFTYNRVFSFQEAQIIRHSEGAYVCMCVYVHTHICARTHMHI